MKCLGFAAAVLGLALAHAETATNIVNGVTVDYSDTYYYVGNTGPYNVLIVTNAGRLNCMPGNVSYIGRNESSDNNSALVTGPGSYWRTGYLNLGLNGADNSLTITNGGVVDTSSTYVGYETNAANNRLIVTGNGSILNVGDEFMFGEKGQNCTLTIANGGRINVDGAAQIGKDLLVDNNGHAVANNAVALVTGSGSVWSNAGSLWVGGNGVGNQLTIAAGGAVYDTTGRLGLSSDSDNQNNRVIVTGANSKWINSGWVVVGDTTSGNHLTITNGGLVVNVDASLGNSANPDANSADNNTVLVAGSGSVWSNSGSLYVGRMGDGNSVTISNSGAVFVGGNVYISDDTLAANNQINLAGGSLVLTNAGAGTLEVRNGSFDFNGGTLQANQLLLTNNTTNGNNAFFNFNHGIFTNTGGSLLIAPAGSDVVIGNTAGQTATWVMLGASNSMIPVVSNTASIVLGGVAGATGNVFVTGAATLWSIDGTLDVRRGSVILDGGVLDVGTLLATNNTDSATNALLAFHSGTLNSHGMRIVVPSGQNLGIGDTAGQTATWNILDGTNGIFAVPGKSTGIYLGSVADALANVLVTGSDTVWSNGADLVVGQASTGNQLTITNGAQVFNNLGMIGNLSSASNNSGLVTGSGSVWNSSSPLVIGNSGAGNALTIANTGRVVSSGGFIGHNTSASNSTALVTGSGSVWTNTSDLTLATDGSGNALTITNGGSVGVAGNSYIGYHYVAHDNTATITGSGSVWNTTGYLAVGYAGFGNQLALANGGVATACDAYVGITSSASNNTVLVTDNSSVWNVTTNLFMGYGGAGNTLIVTNGGTLNVGNESHIGYNASASNNTVLVTGNGSVWTSTRFIYIGSNGVGNAVSVLGGGSVISAAGFIGYEGGASNNTLLVADSGTVWSNRNDLFIGYNGSGNSLIISNQGTVVDDRGFIGSYASSSNNSVLVTGAGSVWSNARDIRMGMNGSGNTLTITNRGTVISSGGGIGQSTSASSNSVLVTGSGSVWTNSGDFTVGGIGVGNQLTIADGGAMYNRRGTVGGNATANGNTALVTGSNSLWNNSGDFKIGTSGSDNRLTITNGGMVTASSMTLGYNDGSTNNTLAISGGTLITTNATYGQLDVRRGAFTFDGGTVLASQLVATNGASSVVQFNAGLLGVGSATVINGQAFEVGDGAQAATLDLRGGVSSFADGLNIASNAQLTGSGSLSNGTVLVRQGGTLAPGHSPGQLTLNGNLQLAASSTYSAELAGYTAGNTYDQLIVNGLATNLDALLAISLLDGFMPTNGAQFVIMDNASSMVGAFSGAPEGSTNTFGSATLFSISYAGGADSHDIVLTAVPEPGAVALIFLLGGALVGWRRLRRWHP
jgi:T5SS/PEP-CTERM-associated repeat protein